MENIVFEKEKEIAMLRNQINFEKAKCLQESENLKSSIIKKAEENLKLANENKNLK